MVTIVSRKCDRCKKEVAAEDNLWEVAITCEPLGIYQHRSQFHHKAKNQQSEWCDPCVKEMGVTRPLYRSPEEVKPLTIEDIIREIIREEQQNKE
jgi:hypothetical protein